MSNSLLLWIGAWALVVGCAAPAQPPTRTAPSPAVAATADAAVADAATADGADADADADADAAKPIAPPLQNLKEEAQTFLDYYVHGATAPRALVAFPGSNFKGIQFRAPAVLGIRPEYEPIPAPNASQLILPGADGPEGTGPYLFLDRCPLRAAVATVVGATVMVKFIFVVKYPPGRFPDASVDQTVEVRLPSSSSFNAVATECLSKFEDTIAFDPAVGFPVGYTVTVLDLRTFESTNG